jgi:hypothetical protein
MITIWLGLHFLNAKYNVHNAAIRVQFRHLDLKKYLIVDLWNVSSIKSSLLNAVLPKNFIQVTFEILMAIRAKIFVFWMWHRVSAYKSTRLDDVTS